MKFPISVKNRLSLNKLEVKSFITTLEDNLIQTIKGQGSHASCFDDRTNVSEEANIEGWFLPHTTEDSPLPTSDCI